MPCLCPDRARRMGPSVRARLGRRARRDGGGGWALWLGETTELYARGERRGPPFVFGNESSRA